MIVAVRVEFIILLCILTACVDISEHLLRLCRVYTASMRPMHLTGSSEVQLYKQSPQNMPMNNV